MNLSATPTCHALVPTTKQSAPCKLDDFQMKLNQKTSSMRAPDVLQAGQSIGALVPDESQSKNCTLIHVVQTQHKLFSSTNLLILYDLLMQTQISTMTTVFSPCSSWLNPLFKQILPFSSVVLNKKSNMQPKIKLFPVHSPS